jgi:hypothetical protein
MKEKQRINLTVNKRVWNTYQEICDSVKIYTKNKRAYIPSHRVEKFMRRDIEDLRKEFKGKIFKIG